MVKKWSVCNKLLTPTPPQKKNNREKQLFGVGFFLFVCLLLFFQTAISGHLMASFLHKSSICNSHYEQQPNLGVSTPSSGILRREEEHGICLPAFMRKLAEHTDLDRVCSLPLSSICSAAPQSVFNFSINSLNENLFCLIKSNNLQYWRISNTKISLIYRNV